MKVSFFIDRPVFSAVISILIVIVGLIGLTMLPIDQYPQITPPVVKISASYPGASALTVSQAVATPIEQELNGTPGMLYMESNSSNSGGFSATITFDISSDPDLSAVEIQNRVKLAESRLPAEVVQNGIEIEKQASSQLMTICLTSNDPKFDEIYLSNFATLNVLDLLRRIPGVGRVSNIGSRYYAMQIWVDPAERAEGPKPRVGCRRAGSATRVRIGLHHPHHSTGTSVQCGAVRGNRAPRQSGRLNDPYARHCPRIARSAVLQHGERHQRG